MRTSDYFYELPPELIAQKPAERRDASRLLVLGRETGRVEHRRFAELPELLVPGDLLVLNDSRVIPARLLGHKVPSGAAMEFLLLEQKERDVWEIMVRPGRKALPGSRFSFGGGILTAEVLEVVEGGNRLARFAFDGGFFDVLDRVGSTPLPPYITRKLEDAERYQTIYARERGSAAAPTAGLHFTDETFAALRGRGVGTAYVTLHVGPGTFRPVKAADIAEHRMHSEHYSVPEETAAAIRDTRAGKGRVIAVGTTTCRTLEAVAREHGDVVACEGATDIFLRPGSAFRVIDGLVTNFHLPESTLIMLVCAFAGYENAMRAYRLAVEERYRFFSFGDSMLIV